MKAFQLKIKRKLCHRVDVSWSTYFLVVLFGIGSWVAVNGVWVELPVLVAHAPEGWKLPSIFAVAIQIANVGPLLHTLFNALSPRKLRDVPAIYVILSLGIAGCGLMAFLWKETGYIDGNEHSIALICFVFLVAFVDCTSSVTFLPFMAAFRKEYMSALFVGGGLSGLLPSLLAIAQDIPEDKNNCANYSQGGNSSTWGSSSSDDLNFGTNVFFFGLMLMMIVSLLAFVGLNTLTFVKRERIDFNLASADEGTIPREAMPVDSSQEIQMDNKNGNGYCTDDDCPEIGNCQRVNYPTQLAFLLILQIWIHAFSNGVVPSIQTYACIPYGNRIYFLTLILSNVVNPLASLVYYWLPTTKVLFIGMLSAIYTSLVAYILYVAALSPNPPLEGNNVGASVIVIMNVLSVAIVTYTKVAISTWMQKQGESHLRWAGIALQSGSFLGAMVIFLFINVFESFSRC